MKSWIVMANAAQDINIFFLPFSKIFLIESAFTKKSNLKEKFPLQLQNNSSKQKFWITTKIIRIINFLLFNFEKDSCKILKFLYHPASNIAFDVFLLELSCSCKILLFLYLYALIHAKIVSTSTNILIYPIFTCFVSQERR